MPARAAFSSGVSIASVAALASDADALVLWLSPFAWPLCLSFFICSLAALSADMSRKIGRRKTGVQNRIVEIDVTVCAGYVNGHLIASSRCFSRKQDTSLRPQPNLSASCSCCNSVWRRVCSAWCAGLGEPHMEHVREAEPFRKVHISHDQLRDAAEADAADVDDDADDGDDST